MSNNCASSAASGIEPIIPLTWDSLYTENDAYTDAEKSESLDLNLVFFQKTQDVKAKPKAKAKAKSIVQASKPHGTRTWSHFSEVESLLTKKNEDVDTGDDDKADAFKLAIETPPILKCITVDFDTVKENQPWPINPSRMLAEGEGTFFNDKGKHLFTAIHGEVMPSENSGFSEINMTMMIPSTSLNMKAYVEKPTILQSSVKAWLLNVVSEDPKHQLMMTISLASFTPGDKFACIHMKAAIPTERLALGVLYKPNNWFESSQMDMSQIVASEPTVQHLVPMTMSQMVASVQIPPQSSRTNVRQLSDSALQGQPLVVQQNWTTVSNRNNVRPQSKPFIEGPSTKEPPFSFVGRSNKTGLISFHCNGRCILPRMDRYDTCPDCCDNDMVNKDDVLKLLNLPDGTAATIEQYRFRVINPNTLHVSLECKKGKDIDGTDYTPSGNLWVVARTTLMKFPNYIQQTTRR